MKYTLIVWSQIPEETSLYLIPNEVAEKYISLLRLANNKIVNLDPMNDGLRFLNAAFVMKVNINDDSLFDDGYTNQRDSNGDIVKIKTHETTPKEWRCVFDQYLVPANTVIDYENDVSITRVIVSGFQM